MDKVGLVGLLLLPQVRNAVSLIGGAECKRVFPQASSDCHPHVHLLREEERCVNELLANSGEFHLKPKEYNPE